MVRLLLNAYQVLSASILPLTQTYHQSDRTRKHTIGLSEEVRYYGLKLQLPSSIPQLHETLFLLYHLLLGPVVHTNRWYGPLLNVF